MAAFSYQNHHFHPDHSFFFPNPPPTKMQGLILEENTNSIPYFSQFNTPTQEIDRVDNNRGDLIINYNNHEPCLTNKQSIDSSVSMVDHIVESGENATSSMEKKRKNRGASSSYSAQSQDAREEKEKKRRMKYKGIEEENPKIGRKNKKKNQNEEELKGYIHVRARRGQATDSHSLAERVRREKISERMKILQALVPGCDKVTGKALMLDEIINYVQSLQNQVEFLSMKLASVNPMLYDFGMDLDGFMVKPESLSNMASQLPSGQPWGPTNTLSNDHPFLDHFASLVFQQAHMPSTTTVSQGNGQALLGGDEQRQKIINQALISNSNSNSLCFPLM